MLCKDKVQIAPASFQQLELMRRLDKYPESAERFNGIIVYQLDGDVNVPALQGAIEDLVIRHSTLRTTMKAAPPTWQQAIHPEPLLPVCFSQQDGISLDEMLNSCYSAWLTAAEIECGTPLFKAEIVAFDQTHLLILNIHHLITDAWSDAIMFRDLAEFYRARIESRHPNLPELPTTFAEFTQRQHTKWTALKQQVVDSWTSQLADYPGVVQWSPPATMTADPYEWRIVKQDLTAQAAQAVRLAARQWHLFPFQILMAATIMAIGDMTGQYDILVGSNMANREARQKRELIGYFTNTRLMRIRLAAHLDLRDAAAIVREQWLMGDEFRYVPTDPLLAELGISQVLKIDAVDLPPQLAHSEMLALPNIKVTILPFTGGQLRDHRDLNVVWYPLPDRFRIQIRHRLAAIDPATATATAAQTCAILTQLVDREELSQ